MKMYARCMPDIHERAEVYLNLRKKSHRKKKGSVRSSRHEDKEENNSNHGSTYTWLQLKLWA